MFGLGPTELIVILVLALLVLGPQRIPEAASSLGKAIRSFRRATRELKDQIDLDDDVRRPFEDLRSALRDEPQRPVFPPLITAPGEDTYPRIPIDEQMNGRGHISDAPPLPPEALPGAPLPALPTRLRQARGSLAGTTLNLRQQLLATVTWSKAFYIDGLNGFNNRDALSHYLTVQSNLQTRDRKYGAVYSFNYDIRQSAMLQQRISGFYNAQCCGVAVEYQRYNYSGLPSYIVPADHRFFMSFTLAGLGNFSPFNGALGGVPR